MKKKRSLLFCCFLLMLFTASTIKPNAAAKEVPKTGTVKSQSTLKKLYTAKNTSDVKLVNHKKDVLQNDQHILYLKNVDDDMTVSFRSSDTSILTVKKLTDSSCRYTGVGYGKASIIITIQKNGVLFFLGDTNTLRSKISVTPHASSVKWSKTSKTITVGKKASIGLTIRPSISNEVPVFHTSDKRIATVDANGKITAKKIGSTYVTATISNGKTTKCRIIVKKDTSPKPVESPKPSGAPEEEEPDPVPKESPAARLPADIIKSSSTKKHH